MISVVATPTRKVNRDIHGHAVSINQMLCKLVNQLGARLLRQFVWNRQLPFPRSPRIDASFGSLRRVPEFSLINMFAIRKEDPGRFLNDAAAMGVFVEFADSAFKQIDTSTIRRCGNG